MTIAVTFKTDLKILKCINTQIGELFLHFKLE